jgi:acyl-coenzyme A thioesterase PaaI-like protein
LGTKNSLTKTNGNADANANNATEHRVLSLWNRWGKTALGRRIYSFILGRTAPYSGSIGAQVMDLRPGFVRVALKDRRAVRNHLNSIHAIALANLGELASGLAMISAVPSSIRAIVVNLEIEYLKKARGSLIAEGRATPPDNITSSITSIVEAEIKDAEGDVVALMKVHWRLSPKETLLRKGDE